MPPALGGVVAGTTTFLPCMKAVASRDWQRPLLSLSEEAPSAVEARSVQLVVKTLFLGVKGLLSVRDRR